MANDPHVHSISIFDCPRIQVVQDHANGCTALRFGRLTINVYGNDPYNVAPELISCADDKEANRQVSREEMERQNGS